jgi:hypothetical protein
MAIGGISVQGAQSALTQALAKQTKDTAADAKAVTAASKDGAKATAAAVAQQTEDAAADAAAVATAKAALAAAQAATNAPPATTTKAHADPATKVARTDGTGALIDTTA